MLDSGGSVTALCGAVRTPWRLPPGGARRADCGAQLRSERCAMVQLAARDGASERCA